MRFIGRLLDTAGGWLTLAGELPVIVRLLGWLLVGLAIAGLFRLAFPGKRK